MRMRQLMMVASVSALALGSVGCSSNPFSYYVDEPTVTNKGDLSPAAKAAAETALRTGLFIPAVQPVDLQCDSGFTIPIEDVGQGVRYIQCARRNLIAIRENTDLLRKGSNVGTAGGVLAAAGSAMFDGGATALMASALGGGSFFGYGKLVDHKGLEEIYSAGIQALNCEEARALKLRAASAKVTQVLGEQVNVLAGNKRILSDNLKSSHDNGSHAKAGSYVKYNENITYVNDYYNKFYGELYRIRANTILSAINAEVLKDLPTADDVMRVYSKVGSTTGSISALADKEKLLKAPAADTSTSATGDGVSDLKRVVDQLVAADNDDGLENACKVGQYFSVTPSQITLSPGHATTIITSTLATASWAGNVPAGATLSTTNAQASRGVTVALPADAAPLAGTYALLVQPADPKMGSGLTVPITVDAASAAQACGPVAMTSGGKPPATVLGSPTPLEKALGVEKVMRIQSALKVKVDGNIGSKTRTAITAKFPTTTSEGKLTQAVADTLLGACR